MRRLRVVLAFLGAAALSAAVVGVAVRQVGGGVAGRPLPLPDPPAPAFAIPAPVALSEARPAGRWTVVLRTVRARVGPSPRAASRALLRTRTQEGTSNVVLVLAKRIAHDGALWIRVAIPGLPGHTTGWVPRRALGAYHAVHTRLVVDLGRRTATLLRDGQPVFSAPVGIGAPSFPTPRGEFYVRSRLTDLTATFYGPLAFATSARSPGATDWPGGGVVGIHGTDRPELLPGRVSHGCIRLRNDDIMRLAGLMPVGTPLTIR
jgi:L,D-transpeptidase catalytic domain